MTATARPSDPASAALARLDRLEGYLRDDPSNGLLLADAFDTALGAGALDRAAFHLEHAKALQLDAMAWRGREAHWLMATARYGDARDVLLELAAEPHFGGPDPAQQAMAQLAVAHDLAYADLQLGEAGDGLARLAPWLTDPDAGSIPPAVEATWVRLLHHTRALPRALEWLAEREAAGRLHPAVAGVGSLVALDRGEPGDHALARRWAEAALQAPAPPEALVTRATLALGDQDAQLSRRLLEAALAHNPRDGRTWSAMGYTELLEQNFAGARQAFDRAIATMPGHIGTWHGMGWAALAQGDLPGARAAFEQALALDRNFAESHGALAAVEAHAGEHDASRAHAERALRLDRHCLSARYAMALAGGELRDAGAVVRLARQLLAGKARPGDS